VNAQNSANKSGFWLFFSLDALPVYAGIANNLIFTTALITGYQTLCKEIVHKRLTLTIPSIWDTH
jgi:hypothetical protein